MATRIGLLYSAPATNTTNNTTITSATTAAVAAGGTAFVVGTARGAIAGTAVLSGMPGDATVETLNRSNTGSPAVSLFRVYCPTGMISGTSLTVTWDTAAVRKLLTGVIYTGVGNANNVATNGANASNNSPSTGTTGATVPGVHVAAWGLNATLGTVVGGSPTDVEGGMTEEADAVVGASNFHYVYLASDPEAAVQVGETAVFTPTGTYASWAGVQGVWADTVVAGAAPQRTLTGVGT